MPFNIITTEGVLRDETLAAIHKAVTDCFLKLHGLTGNAFLERHVIGEITTVPAGRSFAGGQPANLVIVETHVPGFALATPPQKEAYVREVTEVIAKAAEGRVARDRIYVNMLYAVDGLWGIAGRTYTNEELGEAIRTAH